MNASGYFVRDTLVNYSILESLPIERRDKIKELTIKFNQLGYVDARTQIGPDQWARTSQRQRDRISNKASEAFRIETEIKELLKTDDQLQKEAEQRNKEQREARIQQIKYRLRDIEQFLSHKLKSNRENTTKKEHRELTAELKTLTFI